MKTGAPIGWMRSGRSVVASSSTIASSRSRAERNSPSVCWLMPRWRLMNLTPSGRRDASSSIPPAPLVRWMTPTTVLPWLMSRPPAVFVRAKDRLVLNVPLVGVPRDGVALRDGARYVQQAVIHHRGVQVVEHRQEYHVVGQVVDHLAGDLQPLRHRHRREDALDVGV